MIPVNDTAKAIFAQFKLSIGSVHAGRGKDGHALPEMERLGITPKGVVVRNSAVTQNVARHTPPDQREVPLQADGRMAAYEEAPQVNGDPHFEPLNIHHEGQPGRYKNVNVLGTIQPPARQTA